MIEKWDAVRKLQDIFHHTQSTLSYIETDSEYITARNIADTLHNPDLEAQLKAYDMEKMNIDSLYRYVMNHKKIIIRELMSEYDFPFSANFTKE